MIPCSFPNVFLGIVEGYTCLADVVFPLGFSHESAPCDLLIIENSQRDSANKPERKTSIKHYFRDKWPVAYEYLVHIVFTPFILGFMIAALIIKLLDVLLKSNAKSDIAK